MLTDPVRIEHYERLNDSVNGNPRYRVHTDNGVYLTGSDTSASYEVPDNVGKLVTLKLTRAHRITNIEPVDEPQPPSYDFDYDLALIALRQLGG